MDLSTMLQEKGVIVLERSNNPLCDKIKRLDFLSSPRRLMYTEPGPHGYVYEVGPKNGHEADEAEIMSILSSQEMMNFYKKVTSVKRIHIARWNVHIMPRGGYLFNHRDIEQNPNYLVGIVLHLSKRYRGGEFVIYLPDGTPEPYTPEYGTMLILRPDLYHEVKMVTRGVRKTMPYFLARTNGRSGNKNHLIQSKKTAA